MMSADVQPGVSDEEAGAAPARAPAGARRRARAARALAACLSLGAFGAALLAARRSAGGGAGVASAMHGGPLRDEHVLSHRPADDCNYVGAPAPMPGDVWMDATPSGFLLTYTADGQWLPVCANSFSDTSATVACRMLGFQAASSHNNAQLLNAQGIAPGVSCSGRETSLVECPVDPDFKESWSDCRKYPEGMALRLSCYGDISGAAANNYQMGKLFTPELKTAVRKCGSSSVLATLMAEILGDAAPTAAGAADAGGAAAARLGAGAPADERVGAVLGPLLGGVVALGTTVGATAGARDRRAAAAPLGESAAAAAACATCCVDGGRPSLVADLRALAALHSDGLLEAEEYSLAKRRVLASRRR